MLIYPIPRNVCFRLVWIQMLSRLFLAFHIPLIFARKQLKISEICMLFQPVKLQIFCILTIMSVNQWAPWRWRVLFWSCNMYIFFLYVVHWRWIIIFVKIFMTCDCADQSLLKFKSKISSNLLKFLNKIFSKFSKNLFKSPQFLISKRCGNPD